jgi:hypothetical protein
MAAIRLPQSLQEAGANARANAAANAADAYEINKAMFLAPANILSTLGRGVVDFGRGFFGGQPVNAAMVHQAAPARAVGPVAQPDSRMPVTPLTADSIGAYGALSPAAHAVLSRVNPSAVMAADKAQSDHVASVMQGVPSFNQLLAGYAAGHNGKISLQAISSLADSAQRGASASAATARGNVAPRIADIAGAQALQLGTNLYNQQKDEAAKAGNNEGYYNAQLKHLELLKELAKSRPMDPLAYGGGGG